jgi:hypothetical protein
MMQRGKKKSEKKKKKSLEKINSKIVKQIKNSKEGKIHYPNYIGIKSIFAWVNRGQ